MRASWAIDGTRMVLTLRPDVEDTLVSAKPPNLRMLTNQASVRLPFEVPAPHPDLMALAAYSVCSPWTAKRLRFDFPISLAMTEAFAADGVEATGTGCADPRTAGDRVVLSYSGGADSITTAQLLPSDTAHVHFLRVKHPRVPNRMTHVRGSVLAGLARKAGERGREVAVVESDLEYLCLPYATFPVWWAVAIGSILLADHYGAGALALGTVLESRYLRNGIKWSGRQENSAVHRLHAAAGIPLMRPASGMSEVITARLSMESDLADLSRSCLLGDDGGPCLNCDKCLRKELTTAAITGRPLPPVLVKNMSRNPRMLAKITAPSPIYFQNVVSYALARADVSGTPLQEVKDRLAPDLDGTEWMERYYGPAIDDEVPGVFRDDVVAAIAARVDMMSESERRVVETWDASIVAPPA